MDEIRFSVESNLDFDTFKALMMTVTGVCAAFIAIGSLMLFSVVSRKVSGWWTNHTQPPDAPQPSGVGAAPPVRSEAASDNDAQMAAAIGTAVALAMGTGTATAAPRADQGDAGPVIQGLAQHGTLAADSARKRLAGGLRAGVVARGVKWT